MRIRLTRHLLALLCAFVLASAPANAGYIAHRCNANPTLSTQNLDSRGAPSVTTLDGGQAGIECPLSQDCTECGCSAFCGGAFLPTATDRSDRTVQPVYERERMALNTLIHTAHKRPPRTFRTV